MAEGEEQVELKFRIYDGTDIGHGTYLSSTAISVLKQRLVRQWPQGQLLSQEYPLVMSLEELLQCMWWCNILIVERRQKRTQVRRRDACAPSFNGQKVCFKAEC